MPERWLYESPHGAGQTEDSVTMVRLHGGRTSANGWKADGAGAGPWSFIILRDQSWGAAPPKAAVSV